MSDKKHRLLIGAHISIAGGLEKAIERGESIECTTIQIFTKSNRQWKAKHLTKEEIENFKDACKQSNIKPVVAHATYLINIGSPKKEVEQKSIKALKLELERCEKLGIPYLVLHPGSCLKTDETECLNRIAANLDYIFEQVPDHTQVLLETMAGQGSSTCYSFEQIAHIIKKSKHQKRIGVCLDTCHIFAAGYDLRTKKNYNKVWKNFDNTVGLHKLKAIHANDSKKELGSRIDRHEDIGKGKLGKNAFKLLFNDKRFFDIPKIIETPKETLEDDAHNIKTIMSLLSKETKKILGIR